MRDTTERPEGVDAGAATLVGTVEEKIYSEACRLLDDTAAYDRMAQAVSPYGDGLAAERTRYVVLKSLGIDTPEVAMWGS